MIDNMLEGGISAPLVETFAWCIPFLPATIIHVIIVQDWEMPSHLTALKKYMDTFMERDSWKNTYYSPELVIKGWERHGVKVHK